MHPIVRAQMQPGRQMNPRGRHGGRRGRVVIRGGGYFGWPWYYGWPYYSYPYTQPVQTQIVCQKIPGNEECPDGTVVQTNADGSKTCCPPQTSQATASAYPYYGYGYGYGYRYPWWGRRWW